MNKDQNRINTAIKALRAVENKNKVVDDTICKLQGLEGEGLPVGGVDQHARDQILDNRAELGYFKLEMERQLAEIRRTHSEHVEDTSKSFEKVFNELDRKKNMGGLWSWS